MAGLDKILEDIRSESAAAIASVTGEAQAERDKALQEAQKEADAQVQKILSRAKSQADDLIDRADSAAQLQRRRMILETKQDLITSVIGKAKQAILDLPDNDYFDLILKLIGSNALPKEGEICFNRKDFTRLPKDFASKLVAALPEGARLNVSKNEADIDGGFVLKYDGIEQNLSLDEIFEENRDRMTDAAGKLLFS